MRKSISFFCSYLCTKHDVTRRKFRRQLFDLQTDGIFSAATVFGKMFETEFVETVITPKRYLSNKNDENSVEEGKSTFFDTNAFRFNIYTDDKKRAKKNVIPLVVSTQYYYYYRWCVRFFIVSTYFISLRVKKKK